MTGHPLPWGRQAVVTVALLVSGAFVTLDVSPTAAAPQNPKSELAKAKESAENTVRNEALKKAIAGLDLMGRLSNPALAAEAKTKILDAAKGLSEDGLKKLFGSLEQMNGANLKGLLQRKGNAVLAYGQALARGEGADIARFRSLVAGSGDDVGSEAISLLRRLEDGSKSVDKDEVLRILRKLDKERATALLDAIAVECGTKGGAAAAKTARDQLADSMGTMVDGVFVLNDAVNIYYSDEPPEAKAAAATGKAVEYAASTGMGVAAAALGGGLGAGLVIGWSAGKVGELTQEAIGLFHDRENAELKEQWARIELRELAIRRLLRVNELTRAGKLQQAGVMLTALRKYVTERSSEMDTQGLTENISGLDRKISEAHEQMGAKRIIDEARFPFDQALSRLSKGRDLTQALAQAQSAKTILDAGLARYPEHLSAPLAKVEKLETAIRDGIANAPPLTIDGVVVPVGVPAGEYAELDIQVSGGIPAYLDASGSHSSGSYSAVTMYWEAPKELGVYQVTVRVKDNLGHFASAKTNVKVGPAEGAGGSPEEGVAFGRVTTAKVYADFHDSFDSDNAASRSTYHATVTFWNVGAMMPGYGGVSVSYVERHGDESKTDHATGNFTGGPNGTFTISGGERGLIPGGTGRLIGGTSISYSAGDDTVSLAVRPSNAFATWPP